MNSELQIIDDAALSQNSQPAQLVNYGNGVQIVNHGTVNISPNSVYDSAVVCDATIPLSTKYYNLFVIGGEKFDYGRFTISKTRVFVTEYIDPIVKEIFYKLRNDSVVEQILTMPSLFMDENVDFKRSRPGQKVLLGRVTGLEIAANSIEISFTGDKLIFQQNINNISGKLGILANPGCSELTNTHWTIKQIDLIDVLTSVGLIASWDT